MSEFVLSVFGFGATGAQQDQVLGAGLENCHLCGCSMTHESCTNIGAGNETPALCARTAPVVLIIVVTTAHVPQ